MSKLLQDIKQSITKSRNLAYCGKYKESVASFDQVIDTISSYLPSIADKLLIEEWNNLLEQMKNEKNIANNMQQVLQGNFEHQIPKKQKAFREDVSERHLRKENTSEEFPEKLITNPSFKKRAVHEDDEVYNRKERETRDRDRMEKDEAERRQRQFEERQAEIWPKKKPVAPKKQKNSYSYNNPTPVPENKSGVGNNKGRQYSKPWLNGVKNPNGKPNQGEEKKTYLKHCYPDGNGPDANLIQMLEKQVVNQSSGITFEDIAELEQAKDALEEAVLLPLLMPHLFTGIKRPWKGILLFGPPGTGKTLLAKAIASGGKTTFFSVTASSVASKWKGDSQKLIRILFDMAKFYSPTTIFFDEIDSLASKRGDKDDESSRKVKTELMAKIDGCSGGDQGKVVVIGASNCPWDLDDAIKRRFQKRIYIPLPNEIGRMQMFNINLKNEKLDTNVNLDELVKQTDGFSGADIANFCREAAYMPMRKKLKKEGGIGKRLGNVEWMKNFEEEVSVPLTMEDFIQALRNTKPSVGKSQLKRYDDWTAQFGQQGNS